MRRRYSRFGSDDLDHMRIRRDLLRLFREFAEREHLSFLKIAVVCRTSQSRAWNLLNGPIELFNSETLIDILARFGFTMDVSVTKWQRVKAWELVAKDREWERGQGRGG